ncbi:hypothetical protein VCR4J5_1240034 [Vibrio crassostreae]|uniref:Uncharacterized protein n=1 Tax=Vibrio crassostreae TaxID=246167 RepID=A0ABP1WS36_9VIBR|nr:hypothetical protein VCRA2113O20_240056 [Vibrio crassostreae]CAK2049941.1 hypothetical protein VCRA2117O378_370002 [Vibrio crassostreae]CAK2815685.1 hypothetical protein VCRA2123O75_250056 [Vibrio crassostreae]CAK2834449.1 hypothetical protein VCRA2120O56_230056 [Vibrio crassostreae]CAK2972220.1 hypothetical protein VCRA2120O390_370002 [Vibrio crassostreae]
MVIFFIDIQSAGTVSHKLPKGLYFRFDFYPIDGLFLNESYYLKSSSPV